MYKNRGIRKIVFVADSIPSKITISDFLSLSKFQISYQLPNFRFLINCQRNWVFATNSDFLITISLEPNFADLRYFKPWFLLDQIIWVWNIKGLQLRVLKILRFKYLILFQRLNCFQNSYQLPNFRFLISCPISDFLSVAQFQISYQLPNFRFLISCQISDLLSIAKFQNSYHLLNFRILINCQISEFLSIAKFQNSYHLPNFKFIIACQVVQILS